jgi:hypothetical protein
MTMDSLAGAPPKLTIFNVATSESIEAQFNPQEFQYSLQVNYGEITLPGAGYVPQQYTNTSNGTMPLNLFYNSHDEEEKIDRDNAERFLLSLCYPRRGAGMIRQHPPPRAMVVWPRYARLVCVIRGLNISVVRHNMLMDPIEENFQLTLQTIQDGQLFSEDVRRQGLRRPSARSVGSSGETPGDLRGLPRELQGVR